MEKRTTECFYRDCPYHNKTEPLGICYCEDKRFSELCLKYLTLYKE